MSKKPPCYGLMDDSYSVEYLSTGFVTTDNSSVKLLQDDDSLTEIIKYEDDPTTNVQNGRHLKAPSNAKEKLNNFINNTVILRIESINNGVTDTLDYYIKLKK